MQNLLYDCKTISITVSLLTLFMLVGAESVGIVVELGFTILQHISVIWSAVSSPFFCECLNIREKKHFFFQMPFSYEKKKPMSVQVELLAAASSCFANAENYMLTS